MKVSALSGTRTKLCACRPHTRKGTNGQKYRSNKRVQTVRAELSRQRRKASPFSASSQRRFSISEPWHRRLDNLSLALCVLSPSLAAAQGENSFSLRLIYSIGCTFLASGILSPVTLHAKQRYAHKKGSTKHRHVLFRLFLSKAREQPLAPKEARGGEENVRRCILETNSWR